MENLMIYFTIVFFLICYKTIKENIKQILLDVIILILKIFVYGLRFFNFIKNKISKNKQIMEFREYIEKNYDKEKIKLKKYCSNKQIKFDEDIFHTTLLKLLEMTEFQDDTEKGLSNYLFRSFTINLKREKQYARQATRDDNIDDEWIFNFLNNIEDETLENKLKKDSFISYLTNQVLAIVSEKLSKEEFLVFRIYLLTEKKSAEIEKLTNIKNVRQKIINCKRLITDTLDFRQLKNNFLNLYER